MEDVAKVLGYITLGVIVIGLAMNVLELLGNITMTLGSSFFGTLLLSMIAIMVYKTIKNNKE